jgi:hypothetical protein
MSEGRREYDHPLGGRMIMEHTTFLVGDNPELGLLVLPAAAASNSIAKMEKIAASFRIDASSSGVRRPKTSRRNIRRRRRSA